MHVVYKYPLTAGGQTNTPAGQPLFVGEQMGQPTLWVQHDKDDMDFKPQMVFETIGTGHEFSPYGMEYVGSSVGFGPFVWHVFRRV